MARRRRTGRRRSYETQNQRDWAKIERKRKYAQLLKRRAALVKAIRDRDRQREYEYETLHKTRKHAHKAQRVDRRTKDVFKGSAYYATLDGANAARSARSKTAPQRTKTWKQPTSSWKTPSQLAALNKRRKKTRNKWKHDPCVERPDSQKAGKIRQAGTGSGTEPRRWC